MLAKRYTKIKFTTPADVASTVADSPAIFLECDFSNLDLTHIKLDNCCFEAGCCLDYVRLGSACHTKFTNVSMQNADLSSADVSWAKTYNVRCDNINLVGCRITMDCNFISGLVSQTIADGWKLIWWASLANTPVSRRLLGLIPAKYRVIIARILRRTHKKGC